MIGLQVRAGIHATVKTYNGLGGAAGATISAFTGGFQARSSNITSGEAGVRARARIAPAKARTR
jgi:hypothetical protein